MKHLFWAMIALALAATASLATHDDEDRPPPSVNAQAPALPAALPDVPSKTIAWSRRFKLEHDVDCDVSVMVGAATRWTGEGHPLFAKDSPVRPVSLMSVATWHDEFVSSNHQLMWRGLDSDEGLGASATVLGTAFSREPGIAPRSQLSLSVKPLRDWGKVRTENDLEVSVELEPASTSPLQNPTPMREVRN